MDDVTNADRAWWALGALAIFIEDTGVDTPEDAIADLIADLLHVGRSFEFDADALVSRALGMVATEVEEDDEGELAPVRRELERLVESDKPRLSRI